ncbi:MAG: hypothetical protein P1U63_11430 [Coxiellaceae bacterium]|nr:hypothetical protein [Coxiellaceae bacterium]
MAAGDAVNTDVVYTEEKAHIAYMAAIYNHDMALAKKLFESFGHTVESHYKFVPDRSGSIFSVSPYALLVLSIQTSAKSIDEVVEVLTACKNYGGNIVQACMTVEKGEEISSSSYLALVDPCSKEADRLLAEGFMSASTFSKGVHSITVPDVLTMYCENITMLSMGYISEDEVADSLSRIKTIVSNPEFRTALLSFERVREYQDTVDNLHLDALDYDSLVGSLLRVSDFTDEVYVLQAAKALVANPRYNAAVKPAGLLNQNCTNEAFSRVMCKVISLGSLPLLKAYLDEAESRDRYLQVAIEFEGKVTTPMHYALECGEGSLFELIKSSTTYSGDITNHAGVSCDAIVAQYEAACSEMFSHFTSVKRADSDADVAAKVAERPAGLARTLVSMSAVKGWRVPETYGLGNVEADRAQRVQRVKNCLFDTGVKDHYGNADVVAEVDEDTVDTTRPAGPTA